MYVFAEQSLVEAGFSSVTAFDGAHHRVLIVPDLGNRYPCLVHAGWLLPTMDAEGEPAGDADLASRAVIPNALVTAIQQVGEQNGRSLQVWRSSLENLKGRYDVAGTWDGRSTYRNLHDAVIVYDDGRWLICSDGSLTTCEYEHLSDELAPPLGRWPSSTGQGACALTYAARGSKPAIPWRQRGQEREAAKAQARQSEERYQRVHKLLAGVVLHLIILRKRYMAALATRARKLSRMPPRVTCRAPASSSRPALAKHPCSGPACSRARAAGLAGGYTAGSQTRCASCRRDSRHAAAATCLVHRLGARGSSDRRSLLYEIKSLGELSEILAIGPVYKGSLLDSRATARILSLAGLPHRDAQGHCSFPVPLKLIAELLAVIHPKKSEDTTCRCCSSASAQLRCHRCEARFCTPSSAGSCTLHESYGQDETSWLCPDCCQCVAACLASGGDVGQSVQESIAKRTMNALAAAPSGYPSSSCSMLSSIASML